MKVTGKKKWMSLFLVLRSQGSRSGLLEIFVLYMGGDESGDCKLLMIARSPGEYNWLCSVCENDDISVWDV